MSRLTACACGRRWHIPAGPRKYRVCSVCRKAARDAADTPTLRQATLWEWRQLATDREVTAGHTAWVHGDRNPWTTAMAAEYDTRWAS